MKLGSNTGMKAGSGVSLSAAILIALLAGGVHAATTVSNVTVSQRPGSKLVDIAYDVSSTKTNLVTVSVAISNATGLLSASHFTGAVGSVATGAVRKIVWDGGADQNGQNLSSLRVILTATEGGSATPPGGMAAIPAGSFMMGSTECSKAIPVHSITLSALYMDQKETTKALWNQVATWAATNGYDISTSSAVGKAADHPAVQMTWYNALKWCNARSAMNGLTPCYTNANGTVYKTGAFIGGCRFLANGYRLPTEAEWEYAARGTGTTNRFPWTNSNEIKHIWANYYSTNLYSFYDTSATRGYHPDYIGGVIPYTSPVGSFNANAYGLSDMAGNAYEWCWDRYKDTYYSESPAVNPQGPSDTTIVYRTIRGGSAYNNASTCRVAARSYGSQDGTGDYQGFRCAMTAPAFDTTTVVSAPFTADLRDYTLAVTSARGNPAPAVGTNFYAWRATVTASVQSVVSLNGTNWTCTGWTGTGSVPVSGSATNTGAVTLTNLASSLTWQWTVSAFKPTISSQPQSRTNVYATTAVFSVTATGMPAVAYQWRRNGTNLVNGGRISGAQSNSLTLANTPMSDAGNYTVVVSNAMGSVTSQVATLTMNKAALTVTANPTNRPYKTVNPTFTWTISGFVNGDTVAVVSGTPLLSTTATTNSNAGTYPITATQNTLSATNYSFNMVSGTLTVTKASQTICLDALPPEVTLLEESLPLETNASSGLPIQYSSANQAVATVGECTVVIAGVGLTTIHAEQPGDANYLPTESAKTLVVVNPNFGQWAEALGLVGTLGDVFTQDRNSDGIPNGFEYAFGTNLVPSDVLLTIRIVNGQPVVDVPRQDSATVDFVQVWVEGCTNLLEGANGWTLHPTRIEGAPGQPPNRAWYETTGLPARAFFRLKADLK